MSQKPIASPVPASVILTIAVLCCAGPVIIGGALIVAVAWFSQSDYLAATIAAVATGLLMSLQIRLMRQRKEAIADPSYKEAEQQWRTVEKRSAPGLPIIVEAWIDQDTGRLSISYDPAGATR